MCVQTLLIWYYDHGRITPVENSSPTITRSSSGCMHRKKVIKGEREEVSWKMREET